MKFSLIRRQYLSYLFWLGPVLLIVGLVAGLVAGFWVPIPAALMLAGALLTGLWLVVQGSLVSGFWGRRSTQSGTDALFRTLSVLVILGLINFLGIRYAQRIDLTEAKLFTLAPQSQEVVRQLPQPVKVWVFDPIANADDQTLLENYQRQNPAQFSFEIANPDAKPTLAQQFQVKSAGDVYLESGGKRQFVQNTRTDRLSEVKLTNSLEQLNNTQQSKLYLLQGHGELPLDPVQGGLSEATALLKERNFTTTALNLVEQKTVPKDAAVVIVAGPRQGLFAAEVTALTAYLEQGGSLLLLLDPNTQPKLEGLLQPWGLKLDDRLIVSGGQQQAVEYGPAAVIINQYGDHPITKDFGNRFSLYPLSRAIETTAVQGIEATPILITNPQSWAERDLKNPNLQLNPDQGDRPGPLTLGVTLVQPKTKARLVAIGNSSFATNGLFNQQLLNSDVLLNSISWLSRREDQTLSIRPKEAKNRRITLSALTANFLGWTMLGVLPGMSFLIAAIIWWRRR